MKLTIEPTEQMVEIPILGGLVPARVWKGKTETGIEVQLLVSRIAVPKTADQTRFQKELKETSAPAPDYPAFPLRMVI